LRTKNVVKQEGNADVRGDHASSPGSGVDVFQDSTRLASDLRHEGIYEQSSQAEEKFFKTMGRKRHVSRPCRSMSVDAGIWSAAAGLRTATVADEDGIRKRSVRAPSALGNVLPDSRGYIVPALTDKSDCTLTPGQMKYCGAKAQPNLPASPQIDKKSIVVNPGMRYEPGCQQLIRNLSCPPDLVRGRWNPVTHEGDTKVSLAVKRGEGSDERVTAEAGMTSFHISDRKFKEWLGRRSSKCLDPGAWNSNSMEQVTGNQGVHTAAAERAHRIDTDRTFAEQCKATERLKLSTTREAQTYKAISGNFLSHQVANSLQWNA